MECRGWKFCPSFGREIFVLGFIFSSFSGWTSVVTIIFFPRHSKSLEERTSHASPSLGYNQKERYSSLERNKMTMEEYNNLECFMALPTTPMLFGLFRFYFDLWAPKRIFGLIPEVSLISEDNLV